MSTEQQRQQQQHQQHQQHQHQIDFNSFNVIISEFSFDYTFEEGQDITHDAFVNAKTEIKKYRPWPTDTIWKLPYFKAWFCNIMIQIHGGKDLDFEKILNAKRYNRCPTRLSQLVLIAITHYFQGKFHSKHGGLPLLVTLNKWWDHKKTFSCLQHAESFLKENKSKSKVERIKDLEIIDLFAPGFKKLGPLFVFLSIGTENLFALSGFIVNKYGGMKSITDFTVDEAEKVVEEFKKKNKLTVKEKEEEKDEEEIKFEEKQKPAASNYTQKQESPCCKELLNLFSMCDPTTVMGRPISSLCMPIDKFLFKTIARLNEDDVLTLSLSFTTSCSKLASKEVKIDLNIPARYPTYPFTPNQYPSITILNTEVPPREKKMIQLAFEYIVVTVLRRRNSRISKKKHDASAFLLSNEEFKEPVELQFGHGYGLHRVFTTLENNIERFMELDQEDINNVSLFIKKNNSTHEDCSCDNEGSMELADIVTTGTGVNDHEKKDGSPVGKSSSSSSSPNSQCVCS